METQTISQTTQSNINIDDFPNHISLLQDSDIIAVEKSKLPDLIKILQSFVES